jgi:hypothetical protein
MAAQLTAPSDVFEDDLKEPKIEEKLPPFFIAPCALLDFTAD